MEDIRMSQKERRRLELLARVRDQQLSLVEVAELLPLSYPDSESGRYQDEDDAGLVHRLRGRPSARRIADANRRAILDLYETHYDGFGPTLAAEKLAQRDGQHVDHPDSVSGLAHHRRAVAAPTQTRPSAATARASSAARRPGADRRQRA